MLALVPAAALSFSPAVVMRPTHAVRVSGMQMAVTDLAGVSTETGNKVWDPLKLADNMDEGNLNLIRAAELKHGRVAMLATVGWAWTATGAHCDYWGIRPPSLPFWNRRTRQHRQHGHSRGLRRHHGRRMGPPRKADGSNPSRAVEGMLSTSQGVSFADCVAMGDPISAASKVPAFGVWQMIVAIGALEVRRDPGHAADATQLTPHSVERDPVCSGGGGGWVSGWVVGRAGWRAAVESALVNVRGGWGERGMLPSAAPTPRDPAVTRRAPPTGRQIDRFLPPNGNTDSSLPPS